MIPNLKEKVDWALNGWKNGIITKGIDANTREEAKKEEKIWGNKMIGNDKPTNQWTTKLGEQLVHDILTRNGKIVKRPKQISGHKPDWETDEAIWEVKTRNWTTSGTAGEKVLGVPYKYSDVPELYGKPLKIVCVGYQEWELTHGNTRVFGDVSESKKKLLKMWKSMGIEYVKFSDLVPECLKEVSKI